MSWEYKLSHKALKNLKRFPRKDQVRIYEVLGAMKENPFSGDLKPIQDEENLWRRRVGAYRIYFQPLYKKQMLDIPEIERRQSH
ncbi:MAG: hypothetical protein HYX22_03195 [Candidatus Yanofskybacteria bacterium]|nr:hypothetical protein [Candidatus Yanofskybacteria bacterium]